MLKNGEKKTFVVVVHMRIRSLEYAVLAEVH